MLQILQAFVNIALRKTGPEDLPDSRFLLALSAAVYTVTQAAAALPLYGPTLALIRAVGLDLLLLCGCVWGLLRFTGFAGRYRQTLTALLGTGALLMVLTVPLNMWFGTSVDGDRLRLIPVVGVVAVVLWSLAVNAHIVARALSAPFAIGLVASVSYFLLNYLVISQTGFAAA